MRRVPSALLSAAVATFVMSAEASGAAANIEEAKAIGLFYRTVSPTLVWGRNGVLTTPAAETMGPWSFTAAASLNDAGKVQKEVLLDAKESITVATGGEVEVGYTRKDLIWLETQERTPLSSTILHLKYTAVDFGNDGLNQWLPKAAVGAFGYQVNNRSDFNLGEAFVEVFGVVSEIVDVGFFRLRAHAGANLGLLGSQKTKSYLFGGADLTTLDGWLTLAGEFVGARRGQFKGVANVGAAVNIFQVGQVGVMLYNVTGKRQRDWILNAAVNVPLGSWVQSLTER